MRLGDDPPPPAAATDAGHPLLPRAAALHQEGRLDEAAALYREILSGTPQDFDATHLLGVIALQQGRFDDAQHLIHTALGVEPRDASAMANLGTSYMHAGQLEAAHQWFDLALRLQPDSQAANTNLGTVLHNMGRHGDAIPPLRRALGVGPHSYAICILLGVSLAETGAAGEAAQMFEAATVADPDNAEGWEHLAVALNAIGQHHRAQEVAEHALALKPRSSIAFGALGKAQIDQGSLADAVESYRRGIAAAGPTAGMLAAYGSALLSSGLNTEAVEQFSRAVALDGTSLRFRWTRAIARLRPIYDSEPDSIAARGAFAQDLEDVEAWYRSAESVTEPFMAVGIIQPFYLAYQPFNNRELLGRYGALCAAWMTTLPATVSGSALHAPHPGGVDRDGVDRDGVDRGGVDRGGGKLRIGIVSAHIHQHSVWNAITRGWVYNIDRTRFEIQLFKLDVTSDRETELTKAAVAHFEDKPQGLAAWIQAIRNQDLDVLIYPEIGMHPLTLQLACLRLAPVQAAAWGHPETTGIPTIDLYFSAEAFEPPHASANYVEQLVRLPNLGVHVEPLTPPISNPGLASLNLRRGESLLLCAGAPFKYSPLYDDVWVRIAGGLKKKLFRRGTGGRLVFFRSSSDVMDRLFERRLRTAFERAAVGFDDHVSILPLLDRSRFFGLMQESALMLDTLGFSGFNTALQAIECGLPVLAFEGEFMRGRLASGIMRRLGLPELVATTADDFVQRALALAGDPGRRKRLRATVIERREVLFYDLAPIRALESCLTNAVATSRAKLRGTG